MRWELARERAVRARERAESVLRRAERALANGQRLCRADSGHRARQLADDTMLARELVNRCVQAQLASAWLLVETAERTAIARQRLAWVYQRLADAGSPNAETLTLLSKDYRATAEILECAVAYYRQAARDTGDPGEP